MLFLLEISLLPGKIASKFSGTNGQFRTPKHIISMMVELVQSKMNGTICDPAMGSAGFIFECIRRTERSE